MLQICSDRSGDIGPALLIGTISFDLGQLQS